MLNFLQYGYIQSESMEEKLPLKRKPAFIIRGKALAVVLSDHLPVCTPPVSLPVVTSSREVRDPPYLPLGVGLGELPFFSFLHPSPCSALFSLAPSSLLCFFCFLLPV